MNRALRSLTKPVPITVAVVVLIAAVVGVAVSRGGASASPTTKRQFAASIDGSCFETEQALPAGPAPTGAALDSYLDKALPDLRNADSGQDQIALPPSEKSLARQFLARFHDYVTAISRFREARRSGDTALQASATSDAHTAFNDLAAMAEPLDSIACPPQPELP